MKKNIDNLTRREFFKLAGLGTGAMVLFSLLPSAQAAGKRLTATVSRNHGHELKVTLNDLLAKGPHTYNIKGTSMHSHTLEITQEILDTLLDKRVVDVESSSDFMHSHDVRLQIVES